MRSDKAEFELLLTVARLLRRLLQDRHDQYGDSKDVACLDEALKPFDSAPASWSPRNFQPASIIPGSITYVDGAVARKSLKDITS